MDSTVSSPDRAGRRREQNRLAQRRRRHSIRTRVQELEQDNRVLRAFQDRILQTSRSSLQYHSLVGPDQDPARTLATDTTSSVVRECEQVHLCQRQLTAAPSPLETPPRVPSRGQDQPHEAGVSHARSLQDGLPIGSFPHMNDIHGRPYTCVANGSAPADSHNISGALPGQSTSMPQAAYASDQLPDLTSSVTNSSSSLDVFDADILSSLPYRENWAREVATNNVGSACSGGDGRQGALRLAAKRGLVSMVNLLIRHGVDVNGQADNGRTALHDAAEANKYKVIELLLSLGAEVDAVDSLGLTALQLSALLDHNEAVEAIMSYMNSRTGTKLG